MKKFFSFRSHLAYLRKQPVHFQHVYAGSVAGIVTAIFIAYILYTDYGFWHDRYTSGEVLEENKVEKMETPRETLFNLFKETRDRLKNIKENNNQFFGNKDTYSAE